ncbi:MAG: hypothetical protein R3C32_06585 [Chloroflexota bacterium]
MSQTEAPLPPIVFGTDGWRARIGEDYTYENVRRCAQGVAAWVRDAGTASKGVVIGYDRRFSSEHFAQAAAEVLLAYDVPVALAAQAIPTQMTSYEVVEHGFACGVMITASHNPWTDNGFKIKSPTGSAASPDILAVVERVIRENAGATPPTRPLADGEAAGHVQRFDPYPGYVDYVGRSLDLEHLRASDVSVLVDPLWGSGAAASPALGRGRIRVTEIHSERNPGSAASTRAHPPQHRRGAVDPWPRAATTWACCSMGTRTAPARRTSRAPSSISSRRWAS